MTTTSVGLLYVPQTTNAKFKDIEAGRPKFHNSLKLSTKSACLKKKEYCYDINSRVFIMSGNCFEGKIKDREETFIFLKLDYAWRGECHVFSKVNAVRVGCFGELSC